VAELGLPAQLELWLLLAAIPLLLAACTCFTKLAIVLAALRLGLGADRLLPAGSMLALALLLTALIMAPIVEACALGIAEFGGLEAIRADPLELGAEALAPLWEFLDSRTDGEDLALFAGETGRSLDDPLVLAPAFLIGELGRGLGLAVAILLPFVAIDLICAQALVLLGLGNTPTAVIALPAKLLVFLAADGWSTVIAALLEGYR
jgi:type III secretory pathway component EscR